MATAAAARRGVPPPRPPACAATGMPHSQRLRHPASEPSPRAPAPHDAPGALPPHRPCGGARPTPGPAADRSGPSAGTALPAMRGATGLPGASLAAPQGGATGTHEGPILTCCPPCGPGTRTGVCDPLDPASQDRSGLRTHPLSMLVSLTALPGAMARGQTASVWCADRWLLSCALRARRRSAPQPHRRPMETPKSLTPPRLVHPRMVWRRRATRILNSLGGATVAEMRNDQPVA